MAAWSEKARELNEGRNPDAVEAMVRADQRGLEGVATRIAKRNG